MYLLSSVLLQTCRRMRAAALLFAILFTIALAPLSGQEVKVYVSSKAGDRLSAKKPLRFEPAAPKVPTFQIDDRVKYQTMIGFGASILEAGLVVLNTLPPAEQETVLRALFDPETGAGFSAMKTTIGGTDFMSAGPWYTYDDTPDDVDLNHFSIVRDLGPNGSLTFIKRARKYGKFVLQAPMDYPPDWMLYDVNARQDVNPKYYDALTHYYLKYLEEYRKHGVFIDYLSLFNEPGVYTKIPYNEIAELLKNHVGPQLEKSGLKTKIMLSEAPRRGVAYEKYPTVLDDPEARKYVAALPYHGYDMKDFDKIAALHKLFTDLPLWETEVCWCYICGAPKNIPLPRYDWEDGDHWGRQIFGDLGASAAAWIYWNMILDEKGGPWMVSPIHEDPDPNVQHPLVVIDRTAKQVTYTAAFYYLEHFSKFVRPGDVRVKATGSMEEVQCLAFQSPQGGLVAEILNSRGTDAKVALESRGRILSISLPALSITTLIWSPL
ncbi:MAG TPA: glycoside hydrolase family 30 protein [Terriglobia bacterium]|nr:glycoside hydrolase family 30 protein [Terriglobia bacterium]